MARLPNSAIGIDLGFHTLKAVLLQRKGGGRISIGGYSIREVGDRGAKSEELAHHLKLLVQEAGQGAKVLGTSVYDESSILRIIDQPPTPIEVLRSALRFNGTAMLHQECKDYVLDCDAVAKTANGKGGDAEAAAAKPGGQVKYVVGGLPRERVNELAGIFSRNRTPLDRLQVAPLSLFNAFEFARPEVFGKLPFILLDIGHRRSTVVGGIGGELVMVRFINYGGKTLLDDLTMNGAIDRDSAVLLAEQGDAGMGQSARDSLMVVSREMLSSIGFFEGQWDRTIDRVHVSGAATRAEMVLQILSDELNLPCEVWDPSDRCDLALSGDRAQSYKREARNLNVAFGAALELLQVGR